MAPMQRYLTPSTVCTLQLLLIYCANIVHPNARIEFLSLLFSLINDELVSSKKVTENGTSHSKEREKPFESITGIKLLLESMSISEGAKEINVWATFLRVISITKDLDRFGELFSMLDTLFTEEPTLEKVLGGQQLLFRNPIFLSKSSPLGLFVRRAMLEFERLQFDDLNRLWHQYKSFVEPLLLPAGKIASAESTQQKQSLIEESQEIAAIINDSVAISASERSNASLHDVDRLLEFQVNQMQRFGARLPNDMRDALGGMLSNIPTMSLLSHYAKFLDAWYSGDYASAFEYLHRYYDYASHSKDRSNYQYALLNLAILHADFRSGEEAISAMHETIATARENKDMVCLNYSLTWLYHFRASTAKDMYVKIDKDVFGSRYDGLKYLNQKAKELGMRSVESSTLLAETRLCLSHGHPLLEAFEKLYEAFSLNVRYNIDGVMVSQFLMQSSVYERAGIAELATQMCTITLDCYADKAPKEDVVRARWHSAYLAIAAGKYEAANVSVEVAAADCMQNLKLYQLHTQNLDIVRLRRAIMQDDLEEVERWLTKLTTAPDLDRDLEFHVTLLQIEHYSRIGNFTRAYDLIEEINNTFKREEADVYERIRLMSTKVFLFARMGRPQKGLTIALRAVMAAYKAKIIYALWEAVAALGTVLVSLHEYETANNILEVAHYGAEESFDSDLIGRLASVSADANVGLAQQHEHDDKTMKKYLARAASLVEDARSAYESTGDHRYQREMITKAGLISKVLGDGDDEDGRLAIELYCKTAILAIPMETTEFDRRSNYELKLSERRTRGNDNGRANAPKASQRAMAGAT